MTGWQQQIDNQIVEPSDIHGYANGQFPDSALVVVTDHTGQVIGRSSPTVKRAWQAMVAAAWHDGLYLSARSTYRPLSEQQALWNDNYDHTDHGHGGRSCGGDYRYLKDGKNVAACPGTSNHGRTLAFDTNTEVAGILTWLEGNALRFGFQWEIASEDWHIHYFPGDAIPQAVLDFEHHNPTGDDDMPSFLAQSDDNSDHGVYLVEGSFAHAVHLSSMDEVTWVKQVHQLSVQAGGKGFLVDTNFHSFKASVLADILDKT